MHNLEMNDANLKWRDWAAIWSQLTTIWPRLTVASNREGATVNLFGHVKRYFFFHMNFYGISSKKTYIYRDSHIIFKRYEQKWHLHNLDYNNHLIDLIIQWF